jgi:hypothetical protein
VYKKVHAFWSFVMKKDTVGAAKKNKHFLATK